MAFLAETVTATCVEITEDQVQNYNECLGLLNSLGNSDLIIDTVADTDCEEYGDNYMFICINNALTTTQRNLFTDPNTLPSPMENQCCGLLAATFTPTPSPEDDDDDVETQEGETQENENEDGQTHTWGATCETVYGRNGPDFFRCDVATGQCYRFVATGNAGFEFSNWEYAALTPLYNEADADAERNQIVGDLRVRLGGSERETLAISHHIPSLIYNDENTYEFSMGHCCDCDA